MNEQHPENKLIIHNSTAEFLIFTQQAGEGGIEVRYEDGSIWLTQKLMAELFNVDVRTISEHLKNIYASGELQEDSVIRKFRITASDGKNYNTLFYSLDAIISVGYRVNSKRATQLRTYTQPVWITIKMRQPRETFSLKYKINCIMRFMVTRHQNSCSNAQTATNHIWGSRVGNIVQMEKFLKLMCLLQKIT